MQIIIDVLAGIGFLTVLGFIWVAFELLKESRREKNAIVHTKLCRETKQDCNPYKCRGNCKGFYLLSETGKNRRKRRGLSRSDFWRSLGKHTPGGKAARIGTPGEDKRPYTGNEADSGACWF